MQREEFGIFTRGLEKKEQSRKTLPASVLPAQPPREMKKHFSPVQIHQLLFLKTSAPRNDFPCFGCIPKYALCTSEVRGLSQGNKTNLVTDFFWNKDHGKSAAQTIPTLAAPCHRQHNPMGSAPTASGEMNAHSLLNAPPKAEGSAPSPGKPRIVQSPQCSRGGRTRGLCSATARGAMLQNESWSA